MRSQANSQLIDIKQQKKEQRYQTYCSEIKISLWKHFGNSDEHAVHLKNQPPIIKQR